MSAVSHADSARRGADPDPHIVELSKLMLARAPELGKGLADRLFREIDAYQDGIVVSKDEVAASCAANLTFVFHSLAGWQKSALVRCVQHGNEARVWVKHGTFPNRCGPEQKRSTARYSLFMSGAGWGTQFSSIAMRRWRRRGVRASFFR